MKIEYLSHFGDDLMVANAARVSMGKWKDVLDEKDEKLIHYLAKHQHTTPFRHPQLQVRVEVPIFLANQLKRHTVGFALNEVSRRYVDDDPTFWIPDQWRLRPAESIKQGSSTVPICESLHEGIKEEYLSLISHAAVFYSNAISMGIAPEMARIGLPQSMMTSWVWTGSLQAWLHFYLLRIDAHAQVEAQWAAKEIGGLLKKHFPVSFEAWRLLNEH